MLLRPGQTSVGNVNQVDMIHISNRLASYNTWKLPFISTIDLASAGFYHYPFSYNPLSFNDFRVKCAFCSITHSKWDKRSNPLDIHKKISPKCSFINLFFKDLGNIEKNNYIISDNISDIKDIESRLEKLEELIKTIQTEASTLRALLEKVVGDTTQSVAETTTEEVKEDETDKPDGFVCGLSLSFSFSFN